MTPDPASIEQLLRQPPVIADAGFSQAVMSGIAKRRRRRQQMLVSTWLVSTVAAVAGIVTHLPSWLSSLTPLFTRWASSAEQVTQQVSDVALQPLWQSSAALVAAGLLAVILAAASAAVWDQVSDHSPLN